MCWRRANNAEKAKKEQGKEFKSRDAPEIRRYVLESEERRVENVGRYEPE